MTGYSEKLLDPRWQKKRLEVLNRFHFTCYLCGDQQTTLHVHHFVYRQNPWEGSDRELIVFCKHCHALVEFGVKAGKNKEYDCWFPLSVKKKELAPGVVRLYAFELDRSESEIWESSVDIFDYKEDKLSFLITMRGDELRDVTYQSERHEGLFKPVNDTINA